MTDYGEELDDVIDAHREAVALEKESLGEFAYPDDTTLCALCEQYIDYGDVCAKCDLWRDGLYEENRWTYDEGVRNG